jgi:hypothetical protein
MPPSAKSRTEFSHVLIFAVAITAGVLSALALQIWLTAAGYEPATAWQQVLSTKAQLRTAGPWWGIAGVSFIAAGVCASALSWFPLPWRRFRTLRWALGALVIFGLAHIGHSAVTPGGVGSETLVAANLAALTVAALMALLGAFITARR